MEYILSHHSFPQTQFEHPLRRRPDFEGLFYKVISDTLPRRSNWYNLFMKERIPLPTESVPKNEHTMDFEGSDMELSEKQIEEFSNAVIEAVSGISQESTGEIDSENFQDRITESILENVRGLTEHLALEFGSVDVESIEEKVQLLHRKIEAESDPDALAHLQIQLIQQHVALICQVQNGGDKGITPSIAKEVHGIDCTMSSWALKEKLQSVRELSFNFGYPSGHAVGVVNLADDRTLYVDAQNGLLEEVQLEEVEDENNLDTAYPIYQIMESAQSSGGIPHEEITGIRKEGSGYIPRYLGIREDGILHTIGNLHMLTNEESPIYDTETARQFRESLGQNSQNFDLFVDKVTGGKVIQETKFEKLSQEHHKEWEHNKAER